MAFDSFDVVDERSGTALIDEDGSDLSENALIQGIIGREIILVLVSRMGLDDYFRVPPAHVVPRSNRPTLRQWNLVVGSNIKTFGRIAAAKLEQGLTLTLTNPLGQSFRGIFITEDDMRRSGEILTADVLKTAEMADFVAVPR